MLLNFCISSERAERHLIIAHLNSAQLFQAPNVEVVFVRQLSGLEQHHQIGAAGERFPRAIVLRESFESFA